VSKATLDRLREENHVYKKQNMNLIEEMKGSKIDPDAFRRAEYNNSANLKNEAYTTEQELKVEVERLKKEIKDNRTNAKIEDQQATEQLTFSREANERLKEDYEILEERFRKHTAMNEGLVSDLKADQQSLRDNCEKL